MLLVTAGLFGLYMLLRARTVKTQKITIFSLMLANLLQHLLKIYIYPQYWGQEWGALSTAYNMCAFLIIISPFVFLFGSELWRNFMTYVGTVAGGISVLVTYWLADPIEGQLRFVICHALLLYTSALPAMLGIYKINYRKCWRLPFVFYISLGILIVNDVITYSLGIAGDLGDMSLQQFLIRENPCWVMGPPAGYPFIEGLVGFFSPRVFSGIPLLWYAIPLFLLILGGSFGLGVLFDNERFKADFKIFKEKIAEIYTLIKNKLTRREKEE